MNILVAHNFYKEPGGEDECVAAETALLEARGHKVIPYAVHNDAIDGIRRLDVGSRTVWSRPAYAELREIIRWHRPQIVHFHNTFPLISPAGYYAARAEAVPVVQTLHNFRLLCSNALLFRDGHTCEDCIGKAVPWPGIVHKCYRGSAGATAAVAAMLVVHRAIGSWRNAVDAYITPSEFARRKLIEGGLPAERITVKYNFTKSDCSPGNGSGGYALFVGRLSAEKGVDTLVAAWQALDGAIPLKIVGDGPLAGLVESAAAKNGKIQWLGRLPNKSLPPLMGEAAFLVVPSRCYETFGRVVIEAYAMGTPVIASRQGAVAELVEDGRTGLHFAPGDPLDLAERARKIMANPVELSRMRAAAHQRFAARFTADANYRRLMAIYESAAKRPAYSFASRPRKC